ncbi:MAG: cobalamin biosynthesis protein [Nitrospira sp.]|nr:cobalamin biosynthesis protein [Nitrospira sp.]
MMTTHTSTDEQLKDQAIRQALAGDITGARETVSGVVDRRYLRDAWQ